MGENIGGPIPARRKGGEVKTMLLMAACCAAGAVAAALFVPDAASQPRVTVTRQLQTIGAAATNQTHGAWFVDLQSSTVIFCERVAAGLNCQSSPIP
jgi:hypothetical protein